MLERDSRITVESHILMALSIFSNRAASRFASLGGIGEPACSLA